MITKMKYLAIRPDPFFSSCVTRLQFKCFTIPIGRCTCAKMATSNTVSYRGMRLDKLMNRNSQSTTVQPPWDWMKWQCYETTWRANGHGSDQCIFVLDIDLITTALWCFWCYVKLQKKSMWSLEQKNILTSPGTNTHKVCVRFPSISPCTKLPLQREQLSPSTTAAPERPVYTPCPFSSHSGQVSMSRCQNGGLVGTSTRRAWFIWTGERSGVLFETATSSECYR